MNSIYLIGSLRNENVPLLANRIREAIPSLEVFDDWYSPGPRTDDHWKEYEIGKGHTYAQALEGWAARHVFEFDKEHLDRCDGAVLCLPSGRSCHLEFGYMAGQGKRTYVLMDSPERWDVMYQFATGIAFSEEELMEMLSGKSDQVGPPFPQFGPTGSWVGKGPEHEVRGSSGKPPEDSAGDGVQWVPEGASRRQAHAERQGDETQQDDTCGDERDTEFLITDPWGVRLLNPFSTVR